MPTPGVKNRRNNDRRLKNLTSLIQSIRKNRENHFIKKNVKSNNQHKMKNLAKYAPIPLLCLGMAVAMPTRSDAKIFDFLKKKKKDAQTENADTTSKFIKSLADAKIKNGVFDAYLKKDGKLFLSIPDSAYSKTYMLVSRVNGVSATTEMVAGEMNITPLVIRFSKDDNNVYLHIVNIDAVTIPGDPIEASFSRNFLDPIAKSFKIQESSGGRDYIDVTKFFKGDEKLVTPVKEYDPIVVLISGKKGIDGTYYEDGSSITAVKSFPDNIMVESRMAYTTKKAHEPYTVTVTRSIIQLPDNPMRPRLQDNRVGYFYDVKQLYSTALDGSKTYQIINRFRVEPREEDMAAYFRGELVEPKKQIVFYVDSAFPEKWRPAVKEGVEYWNQAFEAAGFKNVVVARDYPTDDPTFDPDDIHTNCIRYCVTPTANAMGPSHVDPRTGEILGADVIWYHNVINLVHNWRFAQTGAVDPRVRKKVFDDDVMNESLTYVTAHEVGHCLGLMHNMGASYAFTIDNLRDPEFTQKYGTTPSIMDYARNNFVAQPGDYERGVRLTPPPVGVYDIHAINWGYRLIPGTDDLFEERPTLDSWIRQHDGDPMYEFGAQQALGIMDPTDQTEDLGNDHIAAGDLAISNLKIIMANFEDWAGEKGADYSEFEKTYMAVVNQYLRHVTHVVPYLGGVKFKEVRQTEGDGAARTYFTKAEQKRAMDWLISQARTCGWLEPENIVGKFEEQSDWRKKLESSIVGCFTSRTVLGRVKKGYELDPSNGYKLEDFLDDATKGLFEASYKNRPLNSTEINLQSTAIAAFAKASGLETLSGVNAGSKSVNAEEDYLNLMAEFSAPAIACSGCPDATALSKDEARSFFRIALGDNPLPESELKPLLTRQLRKIRDLYRQCAASTSDVLSKEFYSYQLMVLNKLLDIK